MLGQDYTDIDTVSTDDLVVRRDFTRKLLDACDMVLAEDLDPPTDRVDAISKELDEYVQAKMSAEKYLL